jgi:hypothetical protein
MHPSQYLIKMPMVKKIRSLFEQCIKCITTNLDISNCEDKPDDNLFTISKMCSDTFHQLRKFSTNTMLSYSLHF